MLTLLWLRLQTSCPLDSFSHSYLPPALAPVGEELFETLVRERMLDELLHHLEGHRGDIRPDTCRFDDVNRTPNAGREHFRLPFVVAVDFDDLGEQLETVLPDVIEPTEERTDVDCTDFGGENRLRGGE